MTRRGNANGHNGKHPVLFDDGNGQANPASGYAVYSREQKLRTKQNTLAELYPPLPTTKYDIIYADPPWDYGGKLQFDRRSTGKETIDFSKNIFISAAAFKYPTLKLEELKKLAVPEIAADDMRKPLEDDE